MRLPKITSVIFSVLLLFFLVSPVQATTDVTTISAQVDSSKNQNPFVRSDNSLLGLIHTTSCLLIGTSSFESQCFGSQNSAPSIGLVDYLDYTLTFVMTEPPLSTKQYLASVGENLGLIKTANAQVAGSGSQVLSVVFIFWEAFRNIAYLLMALIFTITGLMIMLGRKSGTQSVLSVQAALPGFVIGLIMITFSYFIASLLADFAFLGSQVIGFLFSDVIKITQQNATDLLNNFNLISIYSRFAMQSNPNSFTDLITYLGNSDQAIGGIIRIVASIMAGQLTGTAGSYVGGIALQQGLGQLIGFFIGAGAAQVAPELIVSTVIYIVLLVVLMVQMGRLIFDLIKRYIVMLLLTMFSPIIFLGASFPGNGKAYESWIRNMLCQILPFPAVFGGFYFAAFFLGSGGLFGISRSVTLTPATMPLFAGFDLSILSLFIGYGILLGIPSIPEYICKVLKADLADVFGKQIGGDIRTGRSGVGGAVSKGTGWIRKQGTEVEKRADERRRADTRPGG